MLAARDVPLIEDDVYGELHFGPDYPLPARVRPARPRDALQFVLEDARARLPDRLLPPAGSRRRCSGSLMTTLSASIPAQVGIANYLEHGGYDRHLRKLRGALHAQLDRMDDALRRWLPAGVEWVRPEGGYFLWLAFPDAIDAMELHRQAIARGISFAPGPLFSAAHGFERCVRVNFGHPWSRDIERAIRVLGGSSRSRRSARAAESHRCAPRASR